MDSSTLPLVIILFILICAFCGTVILGHFCILSQNLSEIKRHLREEKDPSPRLKHLEKLLEHSPRLILSAQITEGVSAMLLGIFVSYPLSLGIVGFLGERYGALPYIKEIIAVLMTILITTLMIIGCQLVPKIISSKKDKAVLAQKLSGFVNFAYNLWYPLTVVMELMALGIAKLMGSESYDGEKSVTEEEIRMMIDAGNEKGAIEQSERDMIDNIFEFDDNEVQKVMTHRTEMVTLQKDMIVVDAVKIAVEEGYSRIPVYGEDIDDIVGVLYVKDLLPLVGKEKAHKETIEGYLREVIFVPETKRCDDLFRIFKSRKIQIAIVVDEYGGTSGLVSMEDLLEAIVGNIQDEYDDEEELWGELSEGKYIFDGSIDIEEFEKLTDSFIPEEYEDCETLGGLITNILGRIPEENEKPKVVLGGITLTVTKIEDRRIAKVFCEVKKEKSKIKSPETLDD